MARALMIQGTSSWAGKSLLTTAIVRLLADRGHDVVPFKGINMSNNARVVESGEIGVAQYLQALAARVEPEVRMNPVLIKPESDTKSQVVVLGRHDAALSATPWRERAGHLRAAVDGALDSLVGDHAVVVAEGAGSPAEINLSDIDLANMYVARRADASVLLVVDINRGGAFAHLYGTWALLDDEDRARVKGFILNRFRGDPALLAPGPEELERRTGVPVLGVVPWLEHRLPDEDGVSRPQVAGRDAPRVAVVRYPAASNLDEFKRLESIADVSYCRAPAELEAAELVILPGSKHIGGDLAWMRSLGFDHALCRRIEAGGRTLAICGGAQMAGEAIADPHDLESADGPGLGLAPLSTTLEIEKLTERAVHRFGRLERPWSELSGVEFNGYEIRHGRSLGHGVPASLPDDRGWSAGPLLCIYPHGLFENPDVLRAVFPGTGSEDTDTEGAIAELAAAVGASVDIDRIEALVAPRRREESA